MSWTTGIDWTAPAGVALKRLFAELPQDREFQITLFGSSPLQIGLVVTSHDNTRLSEAVFDNVTIESCELFCP